MPRPAPTAHFDSRFSSPSATATPWDSVVETLTAAELYWLTTVRVDGRPHVTPLVGVWHDDAPHFCTGAEEQKARNLAAHADVALTTGANAWTRGLDVVVEGAARPIEDDDALRGIAAAYVTKYNDAWRFDVEGGSFVHDDGGRATVFRIDPRKVLAFAKDPHGQTSFRID